MAKVCILGIAGFIGSHLADQLVKHGYEVSGMDILDSQVHPSGHPPAYLNPKVKFMQGDVCETVVEHLLPVDYVVHLAAKVGVGQSAYQLSDYVWTNSYGTSMLLQSLNKYPPKKLIVASSMSVYGEGFHDSFDGTPWATDEDHPPSLASIYALTKYDQEHLCLLWGRAYNVPTIALRFFNVYGTRQSLNNPYTGVMAIFASRLLNNQPPIIFEDGLQSRDFVHVSDVVRGIRLALESDVGDEVINIGSGQAVTIFDLALGLATAMGMDIKPTVTGKHRVGDIRHCFADITKAERLLGYKPEKLMAVGMGEYVHWLRTQQATDRVEQATAELEERGLLK